MGRRSHGRAIAAIICVLLFPATAVSAQHNTPSIFDISIDELSHMKVDSLSKVAEDAFTSAAAVYVITQEDIKRTGATSIPEILRIVPGLEVARMSSNKWAVTARGFNDQLANKLLVMIDGRTVYTPHFSGVYWDAQDTLLADIERIEVIRGPGGTIWGANAVNGIVNVITKHARDTQGNYAITGIGNVEGQFAALRHGGHISDDLYYRAYGKVFAKNNFREIDGDNAFDDWEMKRAGFRVDREISPQESYTIQGDVYGGKENEGRVLELPTLTPPYVNNYVDRGGDVAGGNIMAKWEKVISAASTLQFQTYFDNIMRNYRDLGQFRNTVNMDFQHIWTPHERHEIIWGGGFRYIAERVEESPFFDYLSDSRHDKIYSAFVQEKLAVVPEKLFLTVGTKLEDNSYTEPELQPSARIAWLVSPEQTLWGAVSRAVRTPSRAENDIELVVGRALPGALGAGTPAGLLKWQGNSAFGSEKLTAYELGYRARILRDASFDVVTYYHDYTDLRTFEQGAVFPDSETALLLPLANYGYGEEYGVEFATTWDPTHNLRLVGSYTFATMDLHRKAGSTDNTFEQSEGKQPHNMISLRSYWDITKTVKFDNAIYYMDNLPSIPIPDYIRFDSKLTWQPSQHISFNLVGQNLLEDYHPEFSESLFSSPTEVPRSVLGYVTWYF